MEVLRARHIELTLDGNRIRAHIGSDLAKGIDGFGATVPEALRELATQIEREKEISIWVPQKAKQCVEDGILKTDCPAATLTRCRNSAR